MSIGCTTPTSKHPEKRPTIGFLAIADFKSSLAQELIAGMDAAAKDLDVNLVVYCSGFKYSLASNYTLPSYYKKLFPFINHNCIDALVTWGSTLSYIMPFEQVEQFHHRLSDMPIACIGMQIENIPSLLIDNNGGIEQIIDHLIDIHGVTKIGFITEERGYKHHFCNEERHTAYMEHLERRGLAIDERLIYRLENTDHKSICKAIHTLFEERGLQAGRDIQALITVSDVISSRLVELLSSKGIQVPKDILVCGFNNTFEGIRCTPPLTSVDVYYYNYGRRAVELVLEQLSKKEVPMITRMPVELIIRESCGCPEKSNVLKEDTKHTGHANSTIENQFYDRRSIIKDISALISRYDPSYTDELAEHLFRSFKKDLLENNSANFVNDMKKYFFSNKYPLEKLLTLQHLITDIRHTLLPWISSNQDILISAENIFHQARIMITISTNYLTMTRINNNSLISKLALIAADFSSINNLSEFSNLFNQAMIEFEIPRAAVVKPRDPLNIHSGGRICAIHNLHNQKIRSVETAIVPPGILLPEHYFPEERYTAVLQLCNHHEHFAGYLIFFAGPIDITLYDTLRMVISPSLLRILRTRRPSNLNQKTQLLENLLTEESIALDIEDVREGPERRGSKIQASDILNCLYHFINEVSDVEKFSTYLDVSASTLIRKTKQLTGQSIQQLHEKMKIEKAMSMLDSGDYNIAEIAEELGYSSQFYFSNVFKKNTGMPPSHWQKRNHE